MEIQAYSKLRATGKALNWMDLIIFNEVSGLSGPSGCSARVARKLPPTITPFPVGGRLRATHLRFFRKPK